MEVLRERLVARVDSLIAEVQSHGLINPDASLQIEAILVSNDTANTASREPRYIIDTIQLSDWHIQQSARATTREDTRGCPSSAAISHALTTRRPQSCESNSEFSRQSPRHNENDGIDDCEHQNRRPRRKAVGGLRLGVNGLTPPRTPSPPSARQLAADHRTFPKRRKLDADGPAKLQPSTVDKLIESIWEQIHKPQSLVFGSALTEALRPLATNTSTLAILGPSFRDLSQRCRQITGVSRTARSLEVIVQAYWVDCYDARIEEMKLKRPDLRTSEHKRLVMTEACEHFEWSEKELRNRM